MPSPSVLSLGNYWLKHLSIWLLYPKESIVENGKGSLRALLAATKTGFLVHAQNMAGEPLGLLYKRVSFIP